MEELLVTSFEELFGALCFIAWCAAMIWLWKDIGHGEK
jgi:hypothetical protein